MGYPLRARAVRAAETVVITPSRGHRTKREDFMKSNICSLTGQEGELKTVLHEVAKCTSYNHLSQKSALRARLLAEELVSMLPALLENAEGTFWIENEGSKYELHVSVKAKETADFFTREKLLSVSSSGKNEANKGIMGKIRAAAEMMLFPVGDDVMLNDFVGFEVDPSMSFSHAWSLRRYENQISNQDDSAEKAEAWDELEKSIIAKLADDVVVGIRGKKVDIIVHKKF